MAFLKSEKLKKILIKLAVLLFWLGVWQGAFTLISKELLIVSPWNVLTRLFDLAQTKVFWYDTFSTLLRIILGFIIGVLSGTVLAVFTCWSKFIYEVFKPIIELIKATPVVSFILIALVWITKTNVPIFISSLIVIPIIWANVSQGIVKTEKSYLEMAKMYHFGTMKKIKLIYLHSVMPYFTAGFSTALGLCWKAGAAAEVLSTPTNSIGYNLYRSKITLETADLFAWTIVIVILSVIFEKLFVMIINKLTKNKREIGEKI